MLSLLLLAALAAPAPLDTPAVQVRVAPGQVWMEEGASQYLNFDFVIRNGGADTVDVPRVELSIYDAAGGLHYQLMTGAEHGAEGLPSYFPGVRVRRGTEWVPAPNAQIDTGDIIDAR